jgi:hypothetical protein
LPRFRYGAPEGAISLTASKTSLNILTAFFGFISTQAMMQLRRGVEKQKKVTRQCREIR